MKPPKPSSSLISNAKKRAALDAKNRCFSDNPTVNNKYYRESEALGRITKDKQFLRDNGGASDQLFHNVCSPHSFCEQHQLKTYAVQ